MNPIAKASCALAILLSTYQAAANQANKSIILTPKYGIELATVVNYIGIY